MRKNNLVFKTFYDWNGFVCFSSRGNLHFCPTCGHTLSFYYLLLYFIQNSTDISDRSIPAQTRNVPPAWFKKVYVKPQGRYLQLFFRIVTDIRYNSIADDCICFSIDGGRIRGFRADELWPFSSGQTGSAEQTQREFHSVELSLIKNSSVRRTASGNAQNAQTRLHARV